MSASPADPLVQAELPASVSVGPGEGGLTRLTVTTDTARAEVYLQGAHLTAWTPAGAAPVIWMSRASAFSRGIPIRGGVPVCFPWFGASAVDASARRHGFARVADWTLVESRDDGQQVGLGFRLTDDESTRASPWPHRFEAVYRVTVRDALVLSLEVTNRDTRALTYEELLHTYFAVSDVRQVRLAGLERVPYLDALDRSQTHRQDAGPLTVTGETDRIYLGTSAARILEDVLTLTLSVAEQAKPRKVEIAAGPRRKEIAGSAS